MGPRLGAAPARGALRRSGGDRAARGGVGRDHAEERPQDDRRRRLERLRHRDHGRRREPRQGRARLAADRVDPFPGGARRGAAAGAAPARPGEDHRRQIHRLARLGQPGVHDRRRARRRHRGRRRQARDGQDPRPRAQEPYLDPGHSRRRPHARALGLERRGPLDPRHPGRGRALRAGEHPLGRLRARGDRGVGRLGEGLRRLPAARPAARAGRHLRRPAALGRDRLRPRRDRRLGDDRRHQGRRRVQRAPLPRARDPSSLAAPHRRRARQRGASWRSKARPTSTTRTRASPS